MKMNILSPRLKIIIVKEDNMNYKTCTKCGEEFPATTEFFHKQHEGKFGLRGRCKKCRKQKSQEYRKNNLELCRQQSYNYYKNNLEKCKQYCHEYYKHNKESINKRNRKWSKNNRDKVCVLASKKRAKKLNQTPDLTQNEKQQICDIYKKSKNLGPNYQVDHIVPLSKDGLHHPDNLQIVTKKYNLEKHDKLNFRLPFPEEIYRVVGESSFYICKNKR